MAKNKYNIKSYYFSSINSFLNSLEYYPEQDRKYEVLEAFIKGCSKPYKLILAYYFHRIMYEKGTSQYFIISNNLVTTTNKLYKINLVQLKFSAGELDRDKDVLASVSDFIFSLNGEVFEFIQSYYHSINITGIRIADIEELYKKYKLEAYIKKEVLTDFSYDVLNIKREYIPKISKLKFPCIIFKGGDLKYFYKYHNEIKTNIDEANVSMVFEKYKKIALIGSLHNNVLSTFVATTKDKVVAGLIKDKSYTIQNSFRYLRGDFNRAKNSLKAYRDFFNMFTLEQADGIIAYDVESLIDNIVETNTRNVLFRNKFISSKFIVIEDIVTEVNSKIVLHKSKEAFELDSFSNKVDLEIGDRVKILIFDKYKFISKREG